LDIKDDGKATVGLVRRYRIVLFGIIVLSAGVAMVSISTYFTSAMFLCSNGSRQASFTPEVVISIGCPVERELAQDLTFKAYFWNSGSAASQETVRMPAHLVIRDPNNSILHERNFDDRTIVSFRPEIYGEYTATVTSLEEKDNPTPGTAFIEYSFGFLVYSDGVENPVGNTIYSIGLFGYALITFGIIFFIVSTIKAAAKKRSSLFIERDRYEL
jgi:hypothetical protein